MFTFQVRCPGANKRQSVDSSTGLGDPERKKVKKTSEAEKEKRCSKAKTENINKWWGGDLKDIYTDRRKKKVDYLEVSDVEESEDDDDDDDDEDEDDDEEALSTDRKKDLGKESRVSISYDEESEDEESLAKRKIFKKKPVTEKPEKKYSKPSSSTLIAAQVFKGKKKEESSEEDFDTNLAVGNKETNKRKSEGLPDSEQPAKADKKSLSNSREKMVTSDSEPEIVKKEVIKIEDDSEEKLAAAADHDLLSNQIREQLLSNKSEKVKCENCNKSLKNSIILQYHQLHCTPVPKPEKKFSIPLAHTHSAVEKKIIDSKKTTASPVDMILKKLTEKVQSSPTPTASVLSPVSSPGSSYRFFKTKGGTDTMTSPQDIRCKICNAKFSQKQMPEHIKTCHDKQISVNVKNIGKSPVKISSCESNTTATPTWRKAGKLVSPPAKSQTKTVPVPENGLSAKRQETVAKAVPKKEVAKKIPAKPVKKAVKKVPLGSSDSEDFREATPPPKKTTKSYIEQSDSDEDSEFEVNTRKRKPTQYCFESCFEAESNEMIG